MRQVIQDRHERWHPFRSSATDGSQHIYPGAHAKTFPEGSAARTLHERFSGLLRQAFHDLVGSKKVNRYWDTGDRDSWEGRILASEVLPGYLEIINSHEENKEEDVDYTSNQQRLRHGGCRMNIDIKDCLISLLEVARNFTPELGDSSDGRKRFHFKRPQERRRLVELRDWHIAAIQALLSELDNGGEGRI